MGQIAVARVHGKGPRERYARALSIPNCGKCYLGETPLNQCVHRNLVPGRSPSWNQTGRSQVGVSGGRPPPILGSTLPRPPGGAFLYDRDKKAPPKRGLSHKEGCVVTTPRGAACHVTGCSAHKCIVLAAVPSASSWRRPSSRPRAARLKKSSIVSNLIQTRTRDRSSLSDTEALPVISPRPKSALRLVSV